jgi:hypothetical protein
MRRSIVFFAAAAVLSASLFAAQGARRQTIQHVTPARDSIGPAPARFVWTAIKEADSYSIGVWNEVDVLIWRQDQIATTSVARPEEVRFEPGTYMWTVSALRNGQEIADSGLAAFIVRTAP